MNEGGYAKMRLTRFAVAVLLAMLLAAAAPSADAAGPAPLPDDLVLPMPGGGGMVFRPVYLGQGGDPFAQRRFKMGDPDGGYKEYPTNVAIAGSFSGQYKGRPDTLYYLGRLEVTRGQYRAVMGETAAAGDDADLPMSGLSWYQAQTFIDRYNQWLYKNAADKLPKSGDAPGFVRLPTEEEWEFAARGGAAVGPDRFDQKTPYDGPIAKHEWFAGPKSSHDKLKPAGRLEPNPLGLHDMLGNVAEMTASPYRIEYYQGKVGGFVARGGHYFTSEKNLRSSMRTEEPFYSSLGGKPPEPNAKPTLGLRLALASVVFADRQAARTYAQAWESYRAGQGASLPAAVSVSPTSTQTKVQATDALTHLARLKKELGPAGSEAALRELGLLEASLGDIAFIKRQAEEDSAYAWSKIAAERGFFIYRELKKLPTLDKLTQIAAEAKRDQILAKYRERRAEIEANIDGALATYSESFRQMEKIDPQAIQAGMERYLKFLLEHQAAEQMRVLKTVREHLTTYLQQKRSDQAKWRADFTALGG